MKTHPLVAEFVNFAKGWFKSHGWTVVYVLEFGSRSRGENIPDSDYDLSFHIYSPDKILIPRYVYPDPSWYDLKSNPLFKKLFLAYPNCVPEWSIDYISELHSTTWGKDPDITIEGNKMPIDIRWMTQNLAEETKHSDFLVELCGQIIFDTGFCSATRKIILKNHLYHIDGIFNSFKNNISESIQEICSQKSKRPWINSALDALLYIMASFSLQKYGKPLWHKTEVMNFVQTNLPAQFDFVSNLYNLKSSNEGRKEAKNYSIESKTEILIKLEKLKNIAFARNTGKLKKSISWIDSNNKHYSKLIHNIMDYL